MMTKSDPQHPKFDVNGSAIQKDHWNSKLQFLADTLNHHVKDDGEREKTGSKGVYFDFKSLKLPS